jgi:hypothetical protein
MLHLGFTPLAFGVGFKLNLASFWGCLSLISHALDCFIGSLKPSKTRSNRLLAYPLAELLEISCCHVGVCAILEDVVQINMFLPTLGGLWWAIGFLFKRSPLVPHVFPIPIAH